jgi:2-polyprenyl-6-methoxyphenol hydroxylase-like FAD-dependent oxidoreductase
VRVIVIGAGVGGLTLAQRLRQAGVDVAVFERDGPATRPQGVSVHLDDRGRSALRACLPPANLAMVEATLGGSRTGTRALSEVDGELTVGPQQHVNGPVGPPRPGRMADRPLLRAVLLAGLEDAVRFGAACTRFERRPDGTVLVRFADGAVEAADVLVGADGVGSAVRRQLLPEVQVSDTGRCMLIGASPLRAVAASGLPALIGDDPATAHVRGSMMVCSVMRFGEPPAAARDRWLPTLHGPVVDAAEDYVMWALSCTREAVGAGPDAAWRTAHSMASGMHPTLRTLVDAAWRDRTVALRIGMIAALPPLPVGPVTILGDAVRVGPGFGANMAMQDAARLGAALVRVRAGEDDLAGALGAHAAALRTGTTRDTAPNRQLVGTRTAESGA